MTWEIQQFQFQDLKQWHAGATKVCIIVAVKTTHKNQSVVSGTDRLLAKGRPLPLPPCMHFYL